jgi:hypothetical protein
MPSLKHMLVAGVACASLATPVLAQDAGAPRQIQHAGKCLLTLGFGGGCDEKVVPSQSAAKAKAAERTASSEPAKVTKVVDNTSTRSQFMHAGKCVVSLGFAGHCDEKLAPATVETGPRAEDNSRLGQMKHAGACVISMGFVGDCDKK